LEEQAVREASAQASKLLGAYDVERSMRMDLYHATQQALDALAPAARADAAAAAGLSAEGLRFLERTLRTFRRNGLHLPDAERAQVCDALCACSRAEMKGRELRWKG
jgi:Zn-dependent oligopeptidase